MAFLKNSSLWHQRLIRSSKQENSGILDDLVRLDFGNLGITRGMQLSADSILWITLVSTYGVVLRVVPYAMEERWIVWRIFWERSKYRLQSEDAQLFSDLSAQMKHTFREIARSDPLSSSIELPPSRDLELTNTKIATSLHWITFRWNNSNVYFSNVPSLKPIHSLEFLRLVDLLTISRWALFTDACSNDTLLFSNFPFLTSCFRSSSFPHRIKTASSTQTSTLWHQQRPPNTNQSNLSTCQRNWRKLKEMATCGWNAASTTMKVASAPSFSQWRRTNASGTNLLRVPLVWSWRPTFQSTLSWRSTAQLQHLATPFHRFQMHDQPAFSVSLRQSLVYILSRCFFLIIGNQASVPLPPFPFMSSPFNQVPISYKFNGSSAWQFAPSSFPTHRFIVSPHARTPSIYSNLHPSLHTRILDCNT